MLHSNDVETDGNPQRGVLAAGSLPALSADGCLLCVLLFRAPVYWKLASGPAHSDATTGLAYLTRWK